MRKPKCEGIHSGQVTGPVLKAAAPDSTRAQHSEFREGGGFRLRNTFWGAEADSGS